MPIAARTAVIVFSIIIAFFGIGAAAVLEVKAGYYECPNCKFLFVPTESEFVKGYHTFTKRKLTCHSYGKHQCASIGL